MSKLIQSEEQYNKALSGLVTMAAQLEDPLSSMTPEERSKKQAVYDRTAELVQYYRRGELVQMFPGLREQYRILGLEWQELGESKEEAPATEESIQDHIDPVPEKEQETEPQEPERPVKEQPTNKLLDWLDD
ncbi:hypothetical protein NYE54_08350 [Paenibacillus sp. FSL K6-1330]|uniref:hypothetical protein n=1 Tax=Paenibacillus sp. FSL K6-1330 TaxID=2975292 RepID=UPI0030D761E7